MSPSPALVGGIATHNDLIPSIIFTILYGLVVFVYLTRMIDKRSRTWVHCRIGSAVIERVILFSLRATVASQPNTESEGLTDYMQWTISVSFIALCQDIALITRSFMVAAVPSEVELPLSSTFIPLSTTSSKDGSSHLSKTESLPSGDKEAVPCSPRADGLKKRIRTIHTILDLLLHIAFVLGIVGHSFLVGKRANYHLAEAAQVLRYFSTVLTLLVDGCLVTWLIWGKQQLKSLNAQCVKLLLIFCSSLTIPAIYRLVVMARWVDSSIVLTSAAPYNIQTSKIIFYCLHIVPEFLVAATICCMNVSETFRCGLMGDQRARPCCSKRCSKKESKNPPLVQ